MKKGDLVEYYADVDTRNGNLGLATSHPYFKLGYNEPLIDVLWEDGEHEWVSVCNLRPLQINSCNLPLHVVGK